MAIMEKRVLLGVQKTKMPTKRSKKIIKKKHFLKKLVDYLKSDSYLFAPLISYSLKNVQEEKRECDKKLVEKVRDYLMSDSYMYTSLVVAPPKPFYVPSKELEPQIKRVTTVGITRRSITLKDKNQLANEMAKASQAAKDSLSKKVIKDRQPQGQKETANHAIYQKYRPSPAPEGMHGSKIRKRC